MFHVNPHWPIKQWFMCLLINCPCCHLAVCYQPTFVDSNTILFTNLAKINIHDKNYCLDLMIKEIICCCLIKAWWECNEQSCLRRLTACCCVPLAVPPWWSHCLPSQRDTVFCTVVTRPLCVWAVTRVRGQRLSFGQPFLLSAAKCEYVFCCLIASVL